MRMRPAWILGWTATMTSLLAAAVAVITLLNFLLAPRAVLLSVLAFFVAGMVLFADMWLRSAAPLAIALAMAGVLFLGLFAPMYAVDKVLAVEGVRTVATVSKVDTTVYTHGSRSYTVWLTDIDGKPIDRSLASSSRRRVGDKFMVVFDPNGLAPTELPATVVRSWPLPAMLVSALATIVGLVLMARRRREV